MTTEKQQLLIQLRTQGITLTKSQLKQLDGQVKSSKAGMMAMGAGIIAATAALAAMYKVISHSIKVGKEFEKNLQNLKAISGATKKEIQGLEKEALRLGRTTKFTASEVAKLQTAYAKLGFKPEEIVEATEATLALAAATGTDLAEAAAVAGSNVRAFGLDVKQTSRVTDVMALSFSKSALDMQKFTDSMSYVAPVAKMAGFEIEDATAMIGTLANAGVSGSMAGTALRRIFLELSNESSKLAKRLGGPISSVAELTPALERLKEEGISTAEMKDLVGQRAISAFSILLEGTETTDNLTESLKNAGGAAQQMAEVQLDSLDGQLKILNSAWEGFGIALYERFEEPLKSATTAMTEFVSELTEYTEVKTSEKLSKDRAGLLALTGALKRNIGDEKMRLHYITEINKKYPDFLNGMEGEEISLEGINGKLDVYNKRFKERIALAIQEEAIIAATDEISDALENQIYYATKLEDRLVRMSIATGVAVDDTKDYAENLEIQKEAIKEVSARVDDSEESQRRLKEANEATGKSYDTMYWHLQDGRIAIDQFNINLKLHNKHQREVEKQIGESEVAFDRLNKVLENTSLQIDDINNKDISIKMDLQTGETLATDEDLMDPQGVSEWVEPAHITEGNEQGLSIVDPAEIAEWEAFEAAKVKADNEMFLRFEKSEADKSLAGNKRAEELAFELKCKGDINTLDTEQVENLGKLIVGGASNAEAISQIYGIAEAEETLADKRTEYRSSLKEGYSEDAEERILQLESMGQIKEATQEQVDAVVVLMEAGASLGEAMRQEFGTPITPFISPEKAQSLFDEFTTLENEYIENSFSIKDNQLAHELELYDQRITDFGLYLDQQVALELMSTEDAEKAKAKITAVYNKKKKQTNFESFSAGITMMSANMNAAAEAGMVSQKAAKKVAIVETIVKTYESAVSAFNSQAGIPIVGPALGAVAAGAAIASGLAQVEAIKGQSTEKPETANVEKYISAGKAAAKAAEGGYIGGKPHSLGGTMIEAERGEFIVKKEAVDKIGVDMLHKINNTARGFTGAKYAEGGLVDVGVEAQRDTEAQPLQINFTGNVLSRDFVESEVIEVLQDFVRRGGEI